MIQRVALDWHASCRANQAFQFTARRELGRFSAGVVINLFFDHRAVEVVRAEAQGDLRDAGRKHDPVRLDVFKIIEHQPRNSDVAQVGVARRLRNVGKRRVVGMKRQRDKRHKTMCLVLQFAQPDEMIDALFFCFHVPVEHRGVRAQTDFVRLACNVEPHLPADLVVANNPAHPGMKNFRAAAGQGIDTGFL